MREFRSLGSIAIISLFLQGVSPVFAQQSSSAVLPVQEWASAPHRLPDGRLVSLVQPANSFANSEVGSMPLIRYRLSGEVQAEPSSFKVVPIKTEPISGDFGALSLSAEVPVRARLAVEQGNRSWIVDWSPYVRGSKGVERILEARLEWSKSAAGGQLKNQKTQTFKQNSVLSSGFWAVFRIESNGVYRLLPADLTAAGFDLNSMNPTFIKIYGSKGGMLSESNSDPVTDDLEEIPVWLIEDGNGRFDGSDRLFFYAQGPDQWREQLAQFGHSSNLYTDHQLIWVTSSDSPAKTPLSASSVSATPTLVLSDFEEFLFIENDLENLVGTGKQWFGEKFDFTLQYSYVFSVPNPLPGHSSTLRFRAAARSSTAGVSMQLGGSGGAANAVFAAVDVSSPGADFVRVQTASAPYVLTGPVVSLTATFQNSSNPSAIAWMDYIELLTRRKLDFTGVDQMLFRERTLAQPGSITEFVFSAAPSDFVVWDVSSPFEVRSISRLPSSTSIRVATDTLREFAAFHPNSNVPRPGFVRNVANQNLHAMSAADLIIVTTAELSTAANRLADHHRNFDGLGVQVVDIAHIYNEFSGGVQDPTAIKSFMRMLYERPSADTLKYLLLFGDASYDYKDRLPNNTNLIPTYESEASFSLNNSYCSDDYFGFLDPDERSVELNQFLDIGIGRFVCRNSSDAQAMVDKLIAYASSAESLGAWRNRILFAADDVDASWETVLMDAAQRAAVAAAVSDPRLDQSKVYQDAYVQVVSGGSERYPEARDALVGGVQKGNLLTAFTGHGGEIGLASERVLQLVDINGWSNGTRLPLIITITCEFTRYDDPKRISAGEYAHLNPSGGAIGLLSTQRVVYASQTTLNMTKNIVDTIFTRNSGRRMRLGDVIRIVKNDSGGSDKRVFSLFGDPALSLNTPLHNIALRTINGQPPGLDTLKALSKVKMEAELVDFGGQPLTQFSGDVDVLVYDKAVSRTTLVNDGVGSPLPFSERTNILYSGKARAANGRFEFEFIVPLDIGFSFGNGRLSAYAQDGQTDASGGNEDFLVGGQDLSAPEDTEGPEIGLYLNDLSFVNGGMTASNSTLIAQLSDSSGINTAGLGIGHELALIIDGKISDVRILNDRYQSESGSYQKGRLSYPLEGLSPGPHSLEVRAWDTYNNPSTARLDFVVRDSEGLKIERVLNYPNPFTTSTDFQFEHNRPGEELEVSVRILSVSGKQVKTLRKTLGSAPSRVSGILWDGKDDYGDRIGRGTYIYQLSVRSTSDGASAEQYQKLVILR